MSLLPLHRCAYGLQYRSVQCGRVPNTMICRKLTASHILIVLSLVMRKRSRAAPSIVRERLHFPTNSPSWMSECKFSSITSGRLNVRCRTPLTYSVFCLRHAPGGGEMNSERGGRGVGHRRTPRGDVTSAIIDLSDYRPGAAWCQR